MIQTTTEIMMTAREGKELDFDEYVKGTFLQYASNRTTFTISSSDKLNYYLIYNYRLVELLYEKMDQQ